MFAIIMLVIGCALPPMEDTGDPAVVAADTGAVRDPELVRSVACTGATTYAAEFSTTVHAEDQVVMLGHYSAEQQEYLGLGEAWVRVEASAVEGQHPLALCAWTGRGFEMDQYVLMTY